MESVAQAHDRILSQPVEPRRFFLVSTRPQRPPASAAVAADSADGLAASTVGITSRRGLCHDGAEQPAPGAALLGTRGDHAAARDVAAGAERRERSAAEQAQSDLCGQSRVTATGRTNGAERAGESRGEQQSAAATAEAWPGVARSSRDDDGGARKKRKSFCSAEPFSLPALLLPRPRNDSDSAFSPDLRHSPCSHPPPQPLLSPQLATSPSRLSRVSTPQTTLQLAAATVPHTRPTAPTTPTCLTAPHQRHDHDFPAKNPFGSAELPRKLVIPPLRPPQVRYSRPSSAVSSSWDVPPFSTKRQCLPARIAGARGGSARGEALDGGTREGGGKGMGGVWETCGDEDGEGDGVDGSALGDTWGECDGRTEREGGGAEEAEGGVEEGMVGMMIRIGECMATEPHRRAHQHNLGANSPSNFSLTSRSSPRQRRGSRAAPVTVSASAQQQQQQQERAREAKEVAMDNGIVEGPAVRVLGSVMTDETVPEGHQGLHGFLYGSQGADVHDAPSQSYALQQGEDDGSLQLPLSDYVARRETLKLAGIYAVYDAAGALQYVGFSRSVVLALKGHAAFVGAERASSVRVRVYSDAAMITRARLEEERQKWIPELMATSGAADSQKLPPGNSADLAEWEGPSGPGTAAMSAAEVAEYEEKKLKLRKAMGENLADAVEDETEDARTRRLNLLRATEGDDWSSVIDRQTASTLPTDGPAAVATAPAAATDSSADTIVSPFARGAGSKGGVKEEVEMTVAAVDAALEAVRPYLIADGGNVEVAGITDGVVSVRLQGACGTCPSSTSTMKMGIEAELQRCFPTQLKEVVQVDVIDTSVTVAAVDGHLDMLRPAISGFGGRVQVVEVNEAEGTCHVAYEGPPTVAMGIQAAIKDKFPTLKTVDIVGFT
ncbi:unnamed protein product [Closterium sp. Naga37s-1]|nr:unnamed protein product [Closterium sp. Naga37s-1]